MNSRQYDLQTVAIAVAVLAAPAGPGLAQGQPHTSETLKTESTGPQDPRSTGSVGRSGAPLSDKLESTGGVIRPPPDIAPDLAVRPPVPEPGTTPVIPPPGTPGGDPTVEPK